MAAARYVVGIDLGTTNSVLAWADAGDPGPDPESPQVRVLPVPQLVRPGLVQERERLGSFLYLPAAGELAPEAMALPWDAAPPHVVGELARARGAEVPRRVVASAKSWLCAEGVDPTRPVLPWNAPDDVPKCSALAAETAYLAHLARAWDAAMPAPLAEQEILLAVPASFDASARELTVRAAAAAGLAHVSLVEEPQAAFYAWLGRSGRGWREQVRVGDVVLVCDVGGGTTDLTLVGVAEQAGSLVLERRAVGDHILLGGDNMDLALAHGVAARMREGAPRLDDWQLRALVHACREAKETLLGADAPAKQPLVVLGRSRKVVGGAVRTEITREDVEATLVDGFFPLVDAAARPDPGRRVGLQEIGLRYAADPAVTRHVAAFLARHREVAPEGATAVLFNGGVTRARRIRERMREALSQWRGEPVRELEGADADLAVACGAVVYGLARRGRGVRIRGGTARAYYVGVEVAAPAVPGLAPPVRAHCVAPFGMEEGSEVELPDAEFALVVGEPAAFRFFASSTRRDDAAGAVVDEWQVPELDELPPLEATLDGAAGETAAVRLVARTTEIGTLEVWCVARDGGRRWKLEFNLRQAA